MNPITRATTLRELAGSAHDLGGRVSVRFVPEGQKLPPIPPGSTFSTTLANVNGVDSFVIRTVPPASPRTARRAILERVGLAIAVVGLLWVVFSVGFALTDRTPPSGGSPPAVAR